MNENQKHDFKEFEKFQVGNYVKADGRLSIIKSFDNVNDEYTLTDSVKKYDIQNLTGIRLTNLFFEEMGFSEIRNPRNIKIFSKDELFIADFTSVNSIQNNNMRYFIYNVVIPNPNDTEFYQNLINSSYAIFHIHALQNYVEKTKETSINFDEIINRLKDDNLLW